MKPRKSILDRSFVYVPASATSVDRTWRRFGWRPLAEAADRLDKPLALARDRELRARHGAN
jgi:hypothetical protein